jgi:hypothetical protein
MKVLMVLTSHDRLGNTDEKTGFWLEEFAAPFYVLRDAGAEITLASPKGGQPPLDPRSDTKEAQTKATERFKQDAAASPASPIARRPPSALPTKFRFFWRTCSRPKAVSTSAARIGARTSSSTASS